MQHTLFDLTENLVIEAVERGASTDEEVICYVRDHGLGVPESMILQATRNLLDFLEYVKSDGRVERVA